MFLQPIQERNLIDKPSIQAIFHNIPAILKIHEPFFEKLDARYRYDLESLPHFLLVANSLPYLLSLIPQDENMEYQTNHIRYIGRNGKIYRYI